MSNIKKWVTEYHVDGKKYSDYAFGSTEQEAQKNLKALGKVNHKIIGEFVAEIDSNGLEKPIKK